MFEYLVTYLALKYTRELARGVNLKYLLKTSVLKFYPKWYATGSTHLIRSVFSITTVDRTFVPMEAILAPNMT